MGEEKEAGEEEVGEEKGVKDHFKPTLLLFFSVRVLYRNYTVSFLAHQRHPKISLLFRCSVYKSRPAKMPIQDLSTIEFSRDSLAGLPSIVWSLWSSSE